MFNRAVKASGAAILGLAALQASGLPAPSPDLAPRGGLKAGMNIAQLVVAVIDYLKGDNAYDPSVPDKCVLVAETISGGSCHASLACSEGSEVNWDDWDNCHLNGVEEFHDDRVGDFSIEFTQAGGVNSDEDGLHHPVFRFADFNDWEKWDVQKIIDDQGDRDEGNLCDEKGNRNAEQFLWGCGIPLKGKTLFGHSFIDDDDDVDGGYKAGTCTAHVVQYQRNEYGTGDKFAFDLVLLDNDKNQIGHIQHEEVDDDGNYSMSSKLPHTLDISTQQADEDPVEFCYNGDCWSCDDDDGGSHSCTLGNGAENGYENGDREGDFGFQC